MWDAGEVGSTTAEVDATMYCSFNTNCRRGQVSQQPRTEQAQEWGGTVTNQDSYHRVMVGVVGVVRQRLDKLEQVRDKAIVNLHEILRAQVLDTRHLVHQLQQEPVQAGVSVRTALDQLE